MASASSTVERLTIPVAKAALDAATASRVAIDSGSLLTKMLFLTELDSDNYNMNFLLMQNGDFNEGLDVVRQECQLLKRDGTDVLKVTGVSYKHEQQFHQLLGATSEFVVEPLCWIRGYHWAVENLDAGDLFYPHELSDPCFCKRGSTAAFEQCHLDEAATGLSADPMGSGKFPAVLVNAGSSVGMCIVNEHGEAVRLSLSFFSCKTLAGLASLLLGTSDFFEIVRLAEAGDRGKVDLKINEMTAEDPLHPFGAYDGDIPLVHLGKIADASLTAEGAKREDIARSLVSLFCFNLFSTILSFASHAQVNNVYVGGNCFRHALFRREFENARAFRLHRADFRHHFLKVGAQVGSIGALVSANGQVPQVLKFPTV